MSVVGTENEIAGLTQRFCMVMFQSVWSALSTWVAGRMTETCCGNNIWRGEGWAGRQANPLNVRRKLKRQWPSDLKDQGEEEE
jgi:hypothetical protein